MDEGAQRSFAEFVDLRQRSLLRMAFLLTGSRPSAHTALRTALLRTWRHWSRIGGTDAAAVAHRAVLAAARPTPPADGDDLGRALWALPPGVRTAVVLRFHEDLSVAETAQLLGCSEQTAASRAARGLDALTAALGVSPLDPPEPALRRRLRMLADGAGEPPADSAQVARELAHEAAARRRRGRAFALVAGVAAVLAAAVPLTARAPEPARSTEAVPVRPESPPAGDRSVFREPTRGSLAADTRFVAELSRVPWGGEPAEVTPESRHVVFAGDVPGGRWALVVGRQVDAEATPDPWDDRAGLDLVGVWLTGPAGAAAAQMSPAVEPTMVTPGVPTALLDPASGTLVVVASPGDAVEVSTRPTIAADGTSSRSFVPVDVVDGVAVVRLDPSDGPYGDALTYRVLEGGPDGLPVDFLSLLALPAAAQDPAIDFPHGAPDGIGLLAARYAADRAVGDVGLPPHLLEVTARWVGGVPEGGPGQAAVVAVAVPSGALLVDSHWLLGSPDGTLQGGDCGRAVLPAGVPLARRVLALACDAVSDPTGRPIGAHLVVLAPPEVALIRTYDPQGRFVSEHPADDGVAVIGLPLGTDTVEAVTSGGVSLGRVDLLGRRPNFGD
jgi:DNA-directed RNA polymerase specialized sigma24 family protein